jgi:hypothetical protein
MMMTSARRVLDRTYTQLHGTLVHSTVSVGVCAFSAVATVHRTQPTVHTMMVHSVSDCLSAVCLALHSVCFPFFRLRWIKFCDLVHNTGFGLPAG